MNRFDILRFTLQKNEAKPTPEWKTRMNKVQNQARKDALVASVNSLIEESEDLEKNAFASLSPEEKKKFLADKVTRLTTPRK